MKLLRNTSFILLTAVIATLTAATVVEKGKGTAYVLDHIYGAPWFTALWGAVVVAAVIYILRKRLHRRVWTFALHASFIVILAGSCVTHIWGEQGWLHLRLGEEGAAAFETRDGGKVALPFTVTLEDFAITYYPGTRSPMDYTSTVRLDGGGQTVTGKVAMNQILRHEHYRFYQSSYDSDMGGSILAVSHDPWGIGLTYAGYAMLVVSMAGFFFEGRSQFRTLLAMLGKGARRTAAIIAVMLVPAVASADDIRDKVLPVDVAEEFGRLYVYHNGRICPMETLARDFTTKLCGKSTYKGLTAEQVLTGWMFYYNYWKREPMIKVKGGDVAAALGIEGKRASLTDFFTTTNAYKLESLLRDERQAPVLKGLREADERLNIASMAATGSIIKIFPCRDPQDSTLHWLSQTDNLPAGLEHGKWMFIRSSLNYVNELIAKKQFDKVAEVLVKIRKYQVKEAAGSLPSAARIGAERVYNRVERPLVLGAVLIVVGVASFAAACMRMARGKRQGRTSAAVQLVMLCAALAWLTVTLGLRWFVSGHLPLSNGFETMQFMAWCALIIAIVLRRRFELAAPFGFTVGGMAVMVSMMGETNPQITQLLPVLSSPLLSLHVVMVMVAYALFAFMMLNGVAAVVLRFAAHDGGEAVGRLAILSRVLLRPAVFALAVGIFIGAVWANVSWGRYWGWDPKEVWALITLLIYSFALHDGSLGAFRRPMFFHVFSIAAFASVAITYFGVNFILGGMHSYA